MTAPDTQAALNYFASQGVKIVTRSETGRYDGPGNGTGPIASVIENSAVGPGMFYLNSAGNPPGATGRPAPTGGADGATPTGTVTSTSQAPTS